MTRGTVLAGLIGGLAALGMAAGAVLIHPEDTHACPATVCAQGLGFTDQAPDLYIQSINATKIPGQNPQVEIEFTVRNGGAKPATNFQVLVSEQICGGVFCISWNLGSVFVPNLAPNPAPNAPPLLGSITVADPPGMPVERWVIVCADSTKVVAETNEGNNCLKQKFTW